MFEITLSIKTVCLYLMKSVRDWAKVGNAEVRIG